MMAAQHVGTRPTYFSISCKFYVVTNIMCAYFVCVCVTEPFPLYAVVIIVLGSLLFLVLLAALVVYRFRYY